MKHNVTKPLSISLLLAVALLLNVMVVPVFATPNQDLWNALMENNLEAAKAALDKGADLKVKAPDYTDDIEDDMKDWTVLMLAIAYGMESESIKFLIDNGVDLDYKLTEGEAKGGSALVIAEIVGHTEAADLLRAAGATLDKEQQTLVNGFKMQRTSYRMRSVERVLKEFWEKYEFYPKAPEEKDISEVISEIEKFRSEKEEMTVGIEIYGEDGWGTPIKYVSDGTSYTLTSYGADKAKGGSGEFDADIVILKQ